MHLKGIKMKKILISLSLLVVFFFSGCAPSSSPEPKAPSSKETQSKSFKTDKKYADIYLCRNSFMGSLWDFPIIVDGKLLGETTAYCHFHWKMKPGKHIIQSKADNTFTLELNTKSNTNYFIIQETKTGMMKAGAELKVVDEAEGKKCVLATKMLKSQLHMSEYERKTSIVEPIYVSPAKYEKYSCSQISKEIEKINERAFKIAEDLKGIDRRNRNIMSIGLISILQDAAADDERVELGKLNGEYNALKTIAKRKKCKFSSTL
jgi:hypothetical protein